MWGTVKSAIPSSFYRKSMQVYDPWNQVLKKVPDPGILDVPALKGSGSYNKAALKGGRSYTNAALKGGKSYTNAALKGGRSYTNAALKGGRSYTNAALKGGKRCRKCKLRGGDVTDDIAQIAGDLGPALMDSLGQMAKEQGLKLEALLKDPVQLMSLAAQYGPMAKNAVGALYSKLSSLWSNDNPYALDPADTENEITPEQELREYMGWLKEHDPPKFRAMMKKIRRLRSKRN